MAKKVKWACPKCGAEPEKHGKGGLEKCQATHSIHSSDSCSGFLCECEVDEPEHGESDEMPCEEAKCYHCDWQGRFPPAPFKLTGWAKKAWDAGWRPPAGWTPT